MNDGHSEGNSEMDGEMDTEPGTAREPTLEEFYGSAIHTYSRAEAIADGVLLDVSKSRAARDALQRLGLLYPVAVTRACWRKFVAVDGPEAESVRLWSLLYTFCEHIRREVRQGRGVATDRAVIEHAGGRFKVICGPGDDASPVLTFLCENED